MGRVALFFCVLCHDGEVDLYAFQLFFFLRIVMLCWSLDVGRLCSILWWRAEDFVPFVCGCLVMGVRRIRNIYGYFSGSFVERVCLFPT